VEEQLRADARATELPSKVNSRAFWKGISKDGCNNATGYANKVGDALGAEEMCHIWKNQYSEVYNMIDDERPEQVFLSKMNDSAT